jgi:endonuclease-3
MQTEHTVQERALRIVKILQRATEGMVLPAATMIVNEYGRDPYLILVSCILSLRTKDSVSWPASRRLFFSAKTPAQMLALPAQTIQSLIYPCGFYRQKTAQILELSTDLIARFGGTVPNTEKELLSLKGVGRKTANLVLGVAFEIPSMCVDVHVHRISNRLGLVQTKTVEETEEALKKVLPQNLWIEYNRLIVTWGQNVCVPQSPFCSTCAIAKECPRIGVTKSR